MSEVRTSDADEVALLRRAEEVNKREQARAEKVDNLLRDALMRDTSPEAKRRRRNAMLRAAYGEFMCTLIFFTPIFCAIIHGTRMKWNSESLTLTAAFVSGLQAVAVCFAFSSVSGAHFNPAVSFALWLTGKLSNRKCVVFIFVQLLASIIAMAIAKAIFYDFYDDAIFETCTVTPLDGDRYLGRVFSTEFFLTFFFVYVAFTVAFEDAEQLKKESMSIKAISDNVGLTVYASNPQSKTGFAPFAIGFNMFSLCLCVGSSGGAFNPARMFGPAIVTGKWDHFYVYTFGQMLGGAAAGLVVNNLHRLGLQSPKEVSNATAAAALSSVKIDPKSRASNGLELQGELLEGKMSSSA
jgi:glycerol uptake facilitator-like aquaporin